MNKITYFLIKNSFSLFWLIPWYILTDYPFVSWQFFLMMSGIVFYSVFTKEFEKDFKPDELHQPHHEPWHPRRYP